MAADVAQIGTEGDSAVAAVRKRLIEAGQHHNAAGEAQGVYDEGYVIVTRRPRQQAARCVEDLRPAGVGAESRGPGRRVGEGAERLRQPDEAGN